MATELKLPELAESMTSAIVTTWLKQQGDRVNAGDPIVEVDTDKTTVEVEAPVSGMLREIVVAAGTEDVAVGTVLAIIDDDEEAASREPAVDAPAAEAVSSGSTTPTPDTPPSRTSAQTESSPEPTAEACDVTAKATPLARRMATLTGLDLSQVEGSGEGGRVRKGDIDQVLGREVVTIREYTEPSRSASRRVTAKRMAEAKRTIPHFYLSAECDMTDLVDLRQRCRAQGRRITITDLIVCAAARALQQVPAANAAWHEGMVRQYSDVHIAVAVNTSDGLIAPVIRDTPHKPLTAISSELRALSARARAGQLSPDEYADGTFTISNLGMFDVSSLYAIINPPQSCTLGVGAVTARPVVRDGTVAIGRVATLTLSADHRVLDGATGGELLREIKARLELPAPLVDEG